MTKNKADEKGQTANSAKLTRLQLTAMDLMLSGTPLQEIAEKVGRSRQTVSEWKNQHPAFRAKLEELRAEAEEELSHSLPMSGSFMVAQLRRLAQDGPPEARLKAVQYYFEILSRFERDVGREGSLLSDSSEMLRRALGQ